jgi:hypothetical protein
MNVARILKRISDNE